MNRSLHKKLIRHDRETITMLEHASQHLGATLATHVDTRHTDLDIIDGVISKAKRHFLERNMLLDGTRPLCFDQTKFVSFLRMGGFLESLHSK